MGYGLWAMGQVDSNVQSPTAAGRARVQRQRRGRRGSRGQLHDGHQHAAVVGTPASRRRPPLLLLHHGSRHHPRAGRRVLQLTPGWVSD